MLGQAPTLPWASLPGQSVSSFQHPSCKTSAPTSMLTHIHPGWSGGFSRAGHLLELGTHLPSFLASVTNNRLISSMDPVWGDCWILIPSLTKCQIVSTLCLTSSAQVNKVVSPVIFSNGLGWLSYPSNPLTQRILAKQLSDRATALLKILSVNPVPPSPDPHLALQTHSTHLPHGISSDGNNCSDQPGGQARQ